MYCILLEFKPLAERENEFLEAWKILTKYIFENYGSKASRLHQSEGQGGGADADDRGAH